MFENFDDFTLLICNYNTPDCIKTVLSSFTYFHNHVQKTLIIENSTNDLSQKYLIENNVPFIKNPKGTHSPSIDIGFENIQTKYCILVDSDVIFKQNIYPILNYVLKNNPTLAGFMQGSRGGFVLMPRISPVLCIIDLETTKKHGIRYHDQERIDKTKSNGFFGNIPINYEDKSQIFYDVGSSFLEDIQSKNLKVVNLTGLEKYFIHLEGGSWYLDSNHEGFINYGRTIKQVYDELSLPFQNIDIKERFKK